MYFLWCHISVFVKSWNKTEIERRNYKEWKASLSLTFNSVLLSRRIEVIDNWQKQMKGLPEICQWVTSWKILLEHSEGVTTQLRHQLAGDDFFFFFKLNLRSVRFGIMLEERGFARVEWNDSLCPDCQWLFLWSKRECGCERSSETSSLPKQSL